MSENATHHVVMLPWSAFGHLIPFFQLSIDIAKSGIHVSFISTPKNIQRLPKPPSDLSHLFHLVEIPFPSSLDSSHLFGGEATVDIPFDKIQYLKLAWDQMQNPVKEFVSKLQPNWIICDFHAHWAVEIAQELHVKLMYFSVYSASTIVFFGPPGQMRAPTSPEDLTSPREWVNFPSSVAFQRNEAIAFYQSAYIENVTGLRDIDRVASVIDSANALSFRSCYEMEGEYLNLYQELIEKPVIPIVLPFVVDQPLNAKALVDKGLAIEVKRNNEDGSFSRDDIAKCLREAMVLEEGEKLRIKTREIAKVVGDLKLHHDYMEEFVKKTSFGWSPFCYLNIVFQPSKKNIEMK
ncbi:hypothetical protein Ahy_A02g009889 isoform C [Arachis hypogaea]|uniref:UDP-glycosyltransferase n=1 Tax=Arachis hypogaea TaxID=3818 RepID=A0A445EID1_ARAHY|nr:hypothetical protein Ahy_A02g009889 isoform C [Arachis hypogaea]